MKYHKWGDNDNEYLREKRLSGWSLKQLSEYFNTSEIAVERQLGRIKVYVGRGGKRENGGRKRIHPIKEARVVSMKDNIEKLWQQQKKKNASKITKFKTVERNFSEYISLKLSDRTTILVKPGTDIGSVTEIYRSRVV